MKRKAPKSSRKPRRIRPRALRSFTEIEALMREIDEFAQKVKSTAVRRSPGGKA